MCILCAFRLATPRAILHSPAASVPTWWIFFILTLRAAPDLTLLLPLQVYDASLKTRCERVLSFEPLAFVLSITDPMSLKLVKSTEHLFDTPQATQSSDEILAGLNPAQAEAVATTDGPLLIVAGAGSGKTRVLTFRVAHLIQRGVKPWNILALTFTNKAAGEMKERIKHICGDNAARQVWAGTFHSIFARLLRSYAEALGFTNSFSIYDTDDSLSAIRGAMHSLNISSQLVSPAVVRSTISSAKNQMTSWQDYASAATDFRERQIAKVYEAYQRALVRNNAMDFDDLLLNMIRLLQQNDEMLQTVQSRFTHILVDEYQDTNRAQYIAVQLLASGHRNLCVVGDDAQSIYRWRGADIRNILDFQKDYPEAKIVRLEQNYRSTKHILASADAVIKNNRKQIPKTLWTDNEEGSVIHIYSNRDDREEADRVMQIIDMEMRTHGTKFNDVAILYRTNAQSQALEDALRRSGTPYTMVSGISFYKRKEVKDAAAYLRLLLNPSDAESLLRVVNEPARGLGDTSLQRLRDHAAQREITLFDAFQEAENVEGLMKRAIKAAHDFASLVQNYRQQIATMPPDDLARQYIESTGLMQHYQAQKTDEAEDRLNNIVRLLTDISEYTLREEEPTLEAYLQQLALVSDVDEADTSQNRVAVMTLHAAKGLEYPCVIITGVEEGLLPLVKDNSHPDEREEERRLFYVGITRACKRLNITYAERRLRFGNVEYSRPSSFLHELPAESIDWQGRREQVQERTRFDDYSSAPSAQHGGSGGSGGSSSGSRFGQRPASSGRPQQTFRQPASKTQPRFDDMPAQESYSQLETAPADVPLKRGMRVRHKLFGDGKVEVVVGEGQNQKVAVMFPGVGRKNLMVKFAKLEVLE